MTGFSCITTQYHISSYLSMKPFITIPLWGVGRLKTLLTGQPCQADSDYKIWPLLVPGETQTQTQTGDTRGEERSLNTEVKWGHFGEQTEPGRTCWDSGRHSLTDTWVCHRGNQPAQNMLLGHREGGLLSNCSKYWIFQFINNLCLRCENVSILVSAVHTKITST